MMINKIFDNCVVILRLYKHYVNVGKSLKPALPARAITRPAGLIGAGGTDGRTSTTVRDGRMGNLSIARGLLRYARSDSKVKDFPKTT